ncbi:hypothetical protein J6590_099400 [Homalodisca vitripennis]|nr:hypothetical protein J6590_099400 [Homalodisca vitripennis]
MCINADDVQLKLSYDSEITMNDIEELNDDFESIRTWSIRHGFKVKIKRVLSSQCSTCSLNFKKTIQVNLQREENVTLS